MTNYLTIAKECGARTELMWGQMHVLLNPDALFAFVERVRADEREACARIAEGVKDKTGWNEPTAYSSGGGWIQRATPHDCAKAIRTTASPSDRAPDESRTGSQAEGDAP